MNRVSKRCIQIAFCLLIRNLRKIQKLLIGQNFFKMFRSKDFGFLRKHVNLPNEIFFTRLKSKSHEIWTLCSEKNSKTFGVQRSPSTLLEVMSTPLFKSKYVYLKFFLTKSHEIWTLCVKKNSAFFGVQRSPSTPLEVMLTTLFKSKIRVF